MENLSLLFKKKSTSIEDLADELLIEIFVRLPCCETIITAKFVSKRWLSLLSNPKFAIDFLNHKKNLPFPLKKPPWTILSMQLINSEGKVRTNSPFHKVFNSPKFSLTFIPFQVKLAATFKDLILCIDSNSNDQYYICNPLTKQWVALPPTPARVSWTDTSWACLVCEDPFYNVIERRVDYKFRVIVVVRPTMVIPKNGAYDPSFTLNLMVFCSENCSWIDIDLRLMRPPNSRSRIAPLKGVVCKGMVCVLYSVYFGLFDPFNVTPTSSRVVEARTLPTCNSLRRGNLLECGGRLISIYLAKFAMNPTEVYYKGSSVYVKGDRLVMTYNELDLNGNNNSNNEVCWKTYNVTSFNQARSPRQSGIRTIHIHPTNNRMIYVLTAENKVFLSNIGSSHRLKNLGQIRLGLQGRFEQFYSSTRLELQYWPTPVPWINPVQ
uniref:F-box domain-containing protein n=1 Tax=Chenopodium quinoa TaxID=63459 RepID=A0A803MCI1_CHEQI